MAEITNNSEVLDKFRRCLVQNNDDTYSLRTSGVLTQGSAYSGGGADRILYVDGSQLVATSANLTYNGTTVVAQQLAAYNTASQPYLFAFATNDLTKYTQTYHDGTYGYVQTPQGGTLVLPQILAQTNILDVSGNLQSIWVAQTVSSGTLTGSGCSLWQQSISKDLTNWLTANAFFQYITGDKWIGSHLHLDSTSDKSTALVLGVHGTGQSGIFVAYDGATSYIERSFVYVTGSNPLHEININRTFSATDPSASGSSSGTSYTGKVWRLLDNAVEKYYVDYLGSIYANGSLTVDGSAKLGDAGTDIHGINTAAVANQSITVSQTNSTDGVSVSLFNATQTLSASTTVGRNAYGIKLHQPISGTDTNDDDPTVYYNHYLTTNDSSTINSATARHQINGIFSSTNWAGTNSSSSEITVTGASIYSTGNITGVSGTKSHYGIILVSTGTADSNYGLYVSCSGATTNYSIYNVGGNVRIGPDNAVTYWGSAQDASINFSGTGFFIRSDVVTSTDFLQLRGGTNGIDFNIGANEEMSLTADLLSFTDATNIATGTTTGTKIGTATTQKIGFYNATPIVQGASVADASGGAVIDAEARTAINALISRIEALGLIATV